MKKFVKLLKPYALLMVLVLAAAALGLVLVKQGEKNHALAAIEGNTEWQDMYARAQERTDQIKDEPKNYEIYNAAMFNWKSLGDATHEPYFYRKALVIGNKAQKVSEVKSALFYLNAGNILKLLGEYDEADEQYDQAVTMNPGDANMWLPYIDLYVNWADKKPEEVIALFDRALSTLLDKTNVTVEKASYLRSIGEWKQSLALYKSLSIVYPDNMALIQKITELELQIANQ